MAVDGQIAGDNLPLVVISHGNGGALSGHSDTAWALAKDGFVVVAVAHTGDNFQDRSYAGRSRWFSDRSRHIRRVVDFMLTQWPERARLDGRRIGFFGFSMGGFTGMTVAGATPEFGRIRAHCAEFPSQFSCALLKRLDSEVLTAVSPPTSTWVRDARIKAAVLAAPGFPYAFDPQQVAAIAIPVQVWVAEHDDSVPAESLAYLRGGFGEGSEYRVVRNAGHFAFLPPCDFSPKLCSDPDGFDRAAFHEELNGAIASFFKRTLAAGVTSTEEAQ